MKEMLLTAIVPPSEGCIAYLGLLKKVPELVLSAKSENTVKAYSCAIRVFASWCNRFKVEWLPASRETIMAYFVHLAERKLAQNSIAVTKAAIVWMYESSGLTSPFNGSLIRLVFEGALRRSKAVISTKAIDQFSFRECMRSLNATSTDQKNLRLAAMICICYYGFLRASEAIQLNIEDLEIDQDLMVIKVKRSKTDQHMKGQSVVVAGRNDMFCPIVVCKRLIGVLKENGATRKDPLLQNLSKQGSKKKRATYNVMRVQFNELQKRCGFKEHFTFHSLRAGGVTGAKLAGIDDSLIMKHGRWKNACTMNRVYYQPNTSQSRIVSGVL